MEALANSVLAGKVPELMIQLFMVIVFLMTLRNLFNKVTDSHERSSATLVSAINTLETRHEENEQKMQDVTARIITESHAFHEKLLDTTHKVITDNTVQMARTQDCLTAVLRKLA